MKVVRFLNDPSLHVEHWSEARFGSRLGDRDPEVCRHFPATWSCAYNDSYRVSTCSSFVARADELSGLVWVDEGSKNRDVPGLVYSKNRTFPTFKTGHHDKWKTWIPLPRKTRAVERQPVAIANAVQEYPCAHAHFLREMLPRFLLLLEHSPVNTFLIPSCVVSKIKTFLKPYEMAKFRFKLWRSGISFAAPRVYFAGSIYPRKDHAWDRISGHSAFGVNNTMGTCNACTRIRERVRLLLPPKPMDPKKMVILQRKEGPRSINNLPALLAMLAQTFPSFSRNVVIMKRHNLSEMHETMGDARVFIAPHGAGLGNIFMLPQQATVVEVGYTGKRSMGFPQMYYQEWSHSCNNTHLVTFGVGEYNSPMSVDLSTMRRALMRILA